MIIDVKAYGFENPKVLTYVGGKTKLSSYLIELIPSHKTYIEVFGGGASLLFKKEPSKYEVYNDIDSSVVALFRVLRDKEKAQKLRELIYLTPYSREEFDYCNNNIENITDDIEKARCVLVKFKQSFGGQGQTWGYAIGRGKKPKNILVSKWLNLDFYLQTAVERLKQVQIENLDFRLLVPKYDFEEAFFFLDPPYICNHKFYKNEMDLNDHKELIDLISNIKGKVMLCGFEHEIYSVLEELGWQKIGFKMQSTCAMNNRPTQIHYVWLNYPIPEKFYQKYESIKKE